MDLYPDYVDLISKNEDAGPCLDAVLDFLTTEYKSWDRLHLSMLSEGSPLVSRMTDPHSPLAASIKPGSVSPFITFSSDFDQVTNAFVSTLKNNIKRRQRQLFEQQGVQYVACPPSQEAEGLRALFDLHERRAKRKNIVSTFKGERLFAFHSDVAQSIQKHDWMWLRFLKSKNTVIAAFYGFAIGNRVFYYQMGFDPEWERYSPGMVLMYEVIKEAFSKHYKEFDFLRGGETYKSLWTQSQRPLVSVDMYNNTLRGGFLKAVSRSKQLMKMGVKQLAG